DDCPTHILKDAYIRFLTIYLESGTCLSCIGLRPQLGTRNLKNLINHGRNDDMVDHSLGSLVRREKGGDVEARKFLRKLVKENSLLLTRDELEWLRNAM